MRILHCKAVNFGSYRTLSLDFEDLGLALIYGPTGSGKSTLQDLVAWCLFGMTSKNGNVDEIRNWTSLEEPTMVTTTIALGQHIIEVTRVRGKPIQNDLYWVCDGLKTRGKDVTDTQKRLEGLLGITKDIYSIGAYFNEFSPINLFFLGKSRDRRDLFELLSDLSLPKKLAERASDKKKEHKKTLSGLENEVFKITGAIEQVNSHIKQDTKLHETWELQKSKNIVKFQSLRDNFESDKSQRIKALEEQSIRFAVEKANKLSSLRFELAEAQRLLDNVEEDKVCPTCGNISAQSKVDMYTYKRGQIQKDMTYRLSQKDPVLGQLKEAQQSVNVYDELLNLEKDKVNPFTSKLEKLGDSLYHQTNRLEDMLNVKKSVEGDVFALGSLYEISFDLRGILLKNTIRRIEHDVNSCLQSYFDSELRVQFEVKDGDDVDMTITVSGHQCVYSQLSKGQRGLLKLSFATTVMRLVSMKLATPIENLFFDESLDGLDVDLKLKAYRVFEDIATKRSSVLVVDHSEELKGLFTKRLSVVLNNGQSEIQDESQANQEGTGPTQRSD